jgi:hypothetical protein
MLGDKQHRHHEQYGQAADCRVSAVIAESVQPQLLGQADKNLMLT